MKEYLSTLWAAICGKAVSTEYVAQLEARIARYEIRAKAQRDARAARASVAPTTTPGASQ